MGPQLRLLDRSRVTYDFGLEERVIEVMQMHVDVIGGDQNGENTKNERSVELIAECFFDTLLFAIGEAIGRQIILLCGCGLKIIHRFTKLQLIYPICQSLRSNGQNEKCYKIIWGFKLESLNLYYTNYMQGQIQEIVCPVCMTIFRRPATLSCGHTFCVSCLLNATRQHRNCPICRQHIASTPAKISSDYTISSFIECLKKAERNTQNKHKNQNIHIQCKEERLLLVDIVTQELLLPFNRITATFQLQSSTLIDRMERFVARQQIPFNKFSVVSRLMHVEPIRKNLYRGVIEGRGFCKIQSEGVESQISLQVDQQQFFYRTCRCKQISESSDTNAQQYNLFFSCFSKIQNSQIKRHIYQKIDPSVFTSKNDTVAIFYSILGILNIDYNTKYQLAVSFDQEKRIQYIKRFMEMSKGRMEKDPQSVVKVKTSRGSGDKRIYVAFLVLMFFLWLSKQKYNDPTL